MAHPNALKNLKPHNQTSEEARAAGRLGGTPTIPHTHIGYFHDEKGTRTLTSKEQKMVDRVLKTWDNRKKR